MIVPIVTSFNSHCLPMIRSMKSFPFRHLQTYDIQWVFVLTCPYSFINSALVLYLSHRLGGIATITRKWCFLVYQLSFIGFCSCAMVASLGPNPRNKQKHDHDPYIDPMAAAFWGRFSLWWNLCLKTSNGSRSAQVSDKLRAIVELRSLILMILQI